MTTPLDRQYFSKLPTSGTHPRSTAVMHTRDWRTALRSPPTYRLGNRTFRFNYHFMFLIGALILICLTLLYVKTTAFESFNDARTFYIHNTKSSYNNTYPLSVPIVSRGTQTFRIGMIADMDTASKSGNVWRSYFKKGFLMFNERQQEVKIIWDDKDPVKLESSFSLKDRAMELSELVTFNGKLLTFDDRTGLVYEIYNDNVIPWIILLDESGFPVKGFKSEWATVKDQMLYVGSMGKEWTTAHGEFQNENPMFVKVISPGGEVHSLNWALNYKNLREKSMGIVWPGYMIHESAVWSAVHKKWFFLPRRCSNEKYNETRDEYMGCNQLITADETFSNIQTVQLPNNEPTHGFSSFKFIPCCEDKYILAIKSQEVNGKTSTFVTVFTINGSVLLPVQTVSTDLKYEGIDFI